MCTITYIHTNLTQSKFKKSLAFTLAEVIIVMGIIGIIAEMTIPTLMNNVQKQQYVIGFQKVYVTFNQVLKQIANDYGCTGDLKCTGLFSASTTQQQFGDAIVKYFKVSRNCQVAAGECFSTSVCNKYDGSEARYDANVIADYRFITLDGIAYRIVSYQTDCALNASIGTTGNLTQLCGIVLADINGPQNGPNNFGRDLFTFYITNGNGPMLYPRGGRDCQSALTWTSAWSGCGSSDTGYGSGYGYNYGAGCGGRIMEEGWKMNY